MKEDLIDTDFYGDWGNYVFSAKEIIWKGKPKFDYSIKTFEQGPPYVFYVNMIFIALGVFALWVLGFPIIATISGFVGVLLPFLFEYIKYFNNQKTEYAITKKYVLFKFYNLLGSKVKAVPISSISEIHNVEFEEGSATIHLLQNQNPNFSTYNVKTMKKQDHVTLEYVEDHEHVNKMLNELTANNKPLDVTYKEPMVSGSLLKSMKVVYAILLGILSIIVLDCFLIPTVQLEEQITDKITWRKFITQNDYRFILITPKRILNETVEFKATRIFGVVKKVKLKNKEVFMKLASGFKDIFHTSFFFLFYVSIIGANILMAGKESVRKIVFSRILSASIVSFLLVLFAWWNIQ